jgi:hypothetical protein
MMPLETLSMSEGGLVVSSVQDGDRINAVFSGVAELDVRERLPELLKRLHAEVQQRKVKEVTVDFHKLEFMNSSCFKGFVSWINDIQELASDKQYRLRFRSNPEILWQRRSVHALKCFATDLITVES